MFPSGKVKGHGCSGSARFMSQLYTRVSRDGVASGQLCTQPPRTPGGREVQPKVKGQGGHSDITEPEDQQPAGWHLLDAPLD